MPLPLSWRGRPTPTRVPGSERGSWGGVWPPCPVDRALLHVLPAGGLDSCLLLALELPRGLSPSLGLADTGRVHPESPSLTFPSTSRGAWPRVPNLPAHDPFCGASGRRTGGREFDRVQEVWWGPGGRGSCLTISGGTPGPGLEGVQLESAAPFLTACGFRLGGGPGADVGQAVCRLGLEPSASGGPATGRMEQLCTSQPFPRPHFADGVREGQGPSVYWLLALTTSLLTPPGSAGSSLGAPRGKPTSQGAPGSSSTQAGA